MSIEKAPRNKDSWLENFETSRPDLFYPEIWNEEEQAKVAEIVRPSRMKTSLFSSIPMVCRGSQCPVASICPLLKKNLAPVGSSCPIELEIVREFTISLMRDLNVDEDNLVEVSMVRDLVDQEIQQLRATKRLSLEDFIQDAVIGINENTGEPILKKELHQAVELNSKVLKNKKDLRNQLLASREARAKVGQGVLDSAQVMSDIFEQIRDLDIEKDKLLKRKLKQAESLETDIIEED